MSRSNKKKPNASHLGSSNENQQNPTLLTPSEKKFKEIQSVLQAAVKKYADEYESSSDEEETALSDNVIDAIIRNYKQNNIQKEHLERTQVFLQDAVTYGSSICLICISRIKRNDSIWNCNECYCGFHLNCIQRWSKDTIVHQKQALQEVIQVRDIKLSWYCPKCRHEYSAENIPSKYECYCKKVIDPIPQALLAPHSCGSTCDKDLKPLCSHKCVLLCHPGPCPPCPKMVQVTCLCGTEPPKIRRCNQKEWSCGKICDKPLVCGKHTCPSVCHGGDCPPCSKKSVQWCVCGSSRKLRDCMTPIWQCDKVCDKLLDCKQHTCPKVCHSGECQPCVLSKPRTCPCGKSKAVDLPCTEEVPTCGDTCGKLLECGIHICNRRCHKDNCSPCQDTVLKSCRCGLHSKEVQCKKPYFCETKCKRMKDCNRHPCNRKCCDANCPPCEKVCGRPLNCGNHKCTSICHRGPCYPCNLTESVSCHCGATTLTVPCGRKQKTKPPKCSKPCKVPPDCHHQKRETHKCHFGECPPCRQKCNKKLECSHNCPAPCHSAVLVKIETQKGSMPWEQTKPQFERRALECPNCVVQVAVTCFGGHETCDFPCYLAKPNSCHRPCGRLLKCKNHTCTKPCHEIEGAPDDVECGTNCETCEKPCAKPRPDGCQHACPKPCHPDHCPPCKQMFRITCHCKLVQKYVYCNEWTSTQDTVEMQSCGNQCPFNLKCGHRCRMTCHPEPCPEQMCKKKVKVTCKCKRLKREFACDLVRNGEAIVDCDEECLKKQAAEDETRRAENEKRLKEEELRNKIELEKYEKMFKGKKKAKGKRPHEEAQEEGFVRRHLFLLGTLLVVSIAISTYFLVSYNSAQ